MTETAPSQLHAQSLRLTLRIGAENVLFAIGDPHGKKKIVHETLPMNRSISMAANLREMAARSELLGSGFTRGMAMLNTDVMLMPIDDYQNEDIPTLYHSAFKGHENDELLSNILPDLKAVAVFPVNKDLKSVLAEHFDDLTFMPVQQPVWQRLYHRNFATPRKKLFAYFHDQRMEVFSYAQGRLRFSNSFEGSREHDVLYYLLYAWRQLGYNGETDELLLVGDVPKREWLAERIKQYVQRLIFLNPAAEFGASSASLDHTLPYDLKVVFLGRN